MDLVDRLGIMKRKQSAPSNLGLFAYDGNLIGGLLLGIGMAVTGSCPGTSFVQAGAGNAEGILVIIGGVLGALTFVKVQDSLKSARASKASPKLENLEASSRTPLDIATALGIPPMVLLMIWVPMCLAVMRVAFAKDRSQPDLLSPGLIPPSYGGLLIGLAQLATVYLTGHAVGASSGYEDVARWLSGNPKNGAASQTFFTGSVVFSFGIVCSAALQNYIFYSDKPFVHGFPPVDTAPAVQAIAGGWAMVLGARIAKGCTSGHGISGLSKFSLPSLVTTASMFGMGIATSGVSRL